MRDIKFRAWSNQYERFIKDSCYPIGSDSSVAIGLNGYEGILELGDYQDYSEDTHGYARYHAHDIELLQYTGLKDKNGAEIYEGDIVSAFKNNGLYEVQFGHHDSCDDDGVFDIYYQGFYLLRYFDGIAATFKEPLGRRSDVNLEVIGNIYENPELLEKD